MTGSPIRVCHLSSVHNAFDTRILWKECCSLARAGYAVTLIAPVKEANACPAVEIVRFPWLRPTVLRIALSPWIMLVKALRRRARVYHFHDPELIPAGLLLRLFTRAAVIYDIHEDVAASIRVRGYLPGFLRGAVAWGYRVIEKLSSRFFVQVLAEKYYRRFAPDGTWVLNYPLLADGPAVAVAAPRRPIAESRAQWLFYSGSTTEARGALLHAAIAGMLPDVGVCNAGRCSPDLAERMAKLAPAGGLLMEGIGQAVSRQRLDALAGEHRWLAGLAVFPDSPHYRDKELTKFFEYMLAGLPIVCSNFPAWKEFVEGQGIGLTVDPADPEDQCRKIGYLATHADECREMGERGRRLVRDPYNWQTQEANLLQLYERLVGPAGPGRGPSAPALCGDRPAMVP